MSINTKELIKSSKVWNVRNINTIAKPLGNDYYICSGPFMNNAYPTVSWEICIYLNGYQGGIYGSNDCVKAKYYFYAIQNNGIRMDIGRASHNFNYWTQTSRYNVNMQSLLQHDGSITLGCEVEFTLEDLTLEYIKKDESALYSKALLQNMWQNKEFMDCVIEIIFLLVKNKCLAEELFAVAHKYEISPLKEKCENYIASYIGECDISRICQIVQLYGSLILEKAVAKCISQNRDILTTAEWNNLKRSHGDLTHRLLES
uniref:BTB domain-containing protein n=1 Tax=Meloidogyne floridensis TaxID=298350 RepID=A0A915NZ88_9BILA